jgi:hypothetical protein
MSQHLDFAEAAKQIGYDPDTGEFWRLKKTVNSKAVGERFAHVPASNGYQLMSINNRRYYLHRLAWLLAYGEWPQHQLDHINGDRTDNRIANLREVTNHQNCFNRKIRKPSIHKYQGFGVFAFLLWGRNAASISRKNKRHRSFATSLLEQSEVTTHTRSD